MKYKNQTENRAFQEMLQAAVKRLQNRSGEDLAAKSGAVFHSSRNVLEVLSFYETIEIQLPEFRINSNMDEWHDLEEIVFPMQEILHPQTISLKLPDILAELEKQHTNPPLSL